MAVVEEKVDLLLVAKYYITVEEVVLLCKLVKLVGQGFPFLKVDKGEVF